MSETNYNCGGMVGLNYSNPGAHYYIDSWADELASWGVDYVKLDGVGASDIADVQALVHRSQADRPPDMARIVQQPADRGRLHLALPGQQLAHHRRHRVLLVLGAALLRVKSRHLVL